MVAHVHRFFCWAEFSKIQWRNKKSSWGIENPNEKKSHMTAIRGVKIPYEGDEITDGIVPKGREIPAVIELARIQRVDASCGVGPQ